MLDIQNLKTCCHDNICLTVTLGESISIGGPSGCGKSVFLRAVSDLDPHEGSITLDNQNQQDTPAPQWRKQVGFLPAEYFFWTETVTTCFDDTQQPGWLSSSMLELGLNTSILARPVNQLSAGEKQRMAFLRLLMNQPRCLLLDESCSHLDDETTLAVEKIILNYQQQSNAMVIWVSHDKQQRQRVASRHLMLTDTGLVEASS